MERRLELVQQAVIGVNEQALQEWVEYRAAKKKPMSPLALKKTQNILLKYDEETQQRMVDAAIMNDWQGLHYIEPPKANSTRSRSLEQDLMDKDWAR